MRTSVIIPVYNAEKTVEKAVESAVHLSDVSEILLIEDQSPDRALEVCQQLQQRYPEKVNVFQHPDKGNHGAGASRNLGIKMATGDYIAFLDADDYYLPHRFEQDRIEFEDPNVKGVFGAIGTEFQTERGREEFEQKFKKNTLTTVGYPASGKEVLLGITGIHKEFGIFFHLNGLTIRTKDLLQSGLLFNPELRVHQDTDFIVKLSYHLHLKTGNIRSPIAIRGVHDENRITKIKQYSTTFYSNIFKLYHSLYFWSINERDLDSRVKDVIELRFFAYKISNKRGLSKFLHYIYLTMRNPKLLKTRYRGHAFMKHNE